MEKKREMIRELTQNAWHILVWSESQESKGILTRQQAQSQAIVLIRNLRYGPELKDYFWINDMHPRVIMHPYRSELEGQDVSNVADPDGKYLYVEFVNLVKAQGEGYVEYMWQWKDDANKIVPKVSFVKEFKPWHWIIGTGIYIEDVNEEIAQITYQLSWISLGILVLITLLSGYIIQRGLKEERKRREAETSLKRAYSELEAKINEQKLTQRERNLLFTGIEQISEAILITDFEGMIQYVNPAFEKITGHPREEVIGQNLHILKHDQQDQEVYQQMWNTITSGREWNGHIVNKKKDGSLYNEEMRISPIRNEAGTIVNYLAVKYDVTREVQLERQLQQAQKMEAIGTLAGGIAHDFNNMLFVILGYTQMAIEDVDDDNPVQNLLESVMLSGNRAKDLVQQILTFSRRTEQKLAPIQIAPLLKETLKFLRASLPVTIELRQEIDMNCSNIMADHTQFHQVIMNLCVNAGYAMRKSGGVLKVVLSEIEIEANPPSHLTLKPGIYLQLLVQDNGSGIPPEIQGHIFEPFFTTKPKGEGTGLGLSVVHGIVQSYGGMVTVESEVESDQCPGGSTFTVYIPTIQEDIRPEEASSLPSSEGSEHILIVDDEEMVIQLEKRMAESFGYVVTIATSSQQALEMFRSNPDQFDLVITDQTMPGLTGGELAQEMLQIRPELPIILTTGFSHTIDEKRAKEMNICEFIKKPLERDQFGRIIRQVLDSRKL